MFSNVKLPFNLSLIECVSILGFVAIGYSLLYKLTIYYVLGIPWYINNYNPQLVLFSSLKLIFLSFPIAFLGWYSGELLQKLWPPLSIIIITIFALFLVYLAETKNIKVDVLPYAIIFLYMIAPKAFLIQFDFLQIKGNEISKNQLKRKPKFVRFIYFINGINVVQYKDTAYKFISAFFILILLVVIPIGVGYKEAEKILKNKKGLNEVYLNNDKANWYILDSYSDKFILISSNNEFKIVNYVDVKVFKRPIIVDFFNE